MSESILGYKIDRHIRVIVRDSRVLVYVRVGPPIPETQYSLPLFKIHELTQDCINDYKQENPNEQLTWGRPDDEYRKIEPLTRVLTVEELVKWVGLTPSDPDTSEAIVQIYVDTDGVFKIWADYSYPR